MDSRVKLIESIKSMLPKCGKMQIKRFEKDEIVTTYLAKRRQIGIILEGSVDLIRYEANGNKSIVERFRKNELFGEAFHLVTTNNELFVKANEDTEILIFMYDDMLNQCKNRCKYHLVLYTNLLELILSKTNDQNIRIELLTKNSIREKLLFYFNYLSTYNFGKEFKIPFSFTDLADYFNVDRSSLMRELKHLKDEGFIERNGKYIKLKY